MPGVTGDPAAPAVDAGVVCFNLVACSMILLVLTLACWWATWAGTVCPAISTFLDLSVLIGVAAIVSDLSQRFGAEEDDEVEVEADTDSAIELMMPTTVCRRLEAQLAPVRLARPCCSQKLSRIWIRFVDRLIDGLRIVFTGVTFFSKFRRLNEFGEESRLSWILPVLEFNTPSANFEFHYNSILCARYDSGARS